MSNEFEKFFDLSFDMLAILDSDGLFQNVNPAFSKGLGWSLGELGGRSFWELIVPSDRQDHSQLIKNLSSGHPSIFMDSQIKCKDGSLRTLRWTAYPELDDRKIFLIIREEKTIRSEQEILNQALESSPTGVLIVVAGRIRYCNHLSEQIFGYSKGELTGQPIEILVYAQMRSPHVRLREQYERHPLPRQLGSDLELYGQHKDGRKLNLDIGLNPFRSSEGLAVMCSIITTSGEKTSKINYTEKIQKLELEISVLDRLALTDELTRVNNRRALFKQLELHYRISQNENQPVSFVLIDVDDFKSYNDTFGHIAGDRILKIIAEIMSTSVRRTEIVARYGGEEFGMILPSTDDYEAKNLTERLRKMIEEHEWPLRGITISAGTATICPQSSLVIDPDGINNFVMMADRALYVSKSSGKNRTTHFNDLPIADQEDLSNWKIQHETPTDH